MTGNYDEAFDNAVASAHLDKSADNIEAYLLVCKFSLTSVRYLHLIFPILRIVLLTAFYLQIIVVSFFQHFADVLFL
jgi:hypothetical protein